MSRSHLTLRGYVWIYLGVCRVSFGGFIFRGLASAEEINHEASLKCRELARCCLCRLQKSVTREKAVECAMWEDEFVRFAITCSCWCVACFWTCGQKRVVWTMSGRRPESGYAQCAYRGGAVNAHDTCASRSSFSPPVASRFAKLAVRR